MESLSPAQPPAASEARCPAHPQKAVLGACARCGTFFCEYDRETVNGKDYCDTCAEHPDVDYLEAFRLKYWGKRDAWAWLIGLGAIRNIIDGAVLILQQEEIGNAGLMIGLSSLAGGAVGACFWLGLPFARLALCFVPVVSMLVMAVTVGPQVIPILLIPLLVTIAIYQNTRTKLFFKEEVSREALQRTWHLYSNNTVARAGFMLSFISLALVPVAPISLLCSIIGLRRVDPTATPPVGRKGQAIAGIVLSSVSILGWGLFVFVSRMRL